MDTFIDRNEINEVRPTSSQHVSNHRNNPESGNYRSSDGKLPYRKEDEIKAALIKDLKYADEFMIDMDDFDDMIRNSPRLASRRLRLAGIDKPKTEERKTGKNNVVKGMTITATRELETVENANETSKCISNKYKRYNDDDDDGIGAIAEELMYDDYSTAKCDEKRSRSRSKQKKSTEQKSKMKVDQYHLDEDVSAITKKGKVITNDRSNEMAGEDLNKDIDEIMNVVDHFESNRAARKVKTRVHSEFSNINNDDNDIITNGDIFANADRKATEEKGMRSTGDRSKNHSLKNDKYEFADSDQLNMAPITNKSTEVEIEVHDNKDNDNTSELESYFQHNAKKSDKTTRSTKVVGKEKAKRGNTAGEKVDLVDVLHEVKSDKAMDDDSIKKSKDSDIVAKPGSVVISVQSERQITSVKCAYVETLPGAVPQNTKKMVVKSVTIIDAGDAGVIIIKKLRRKSRLRELLCGCFGSDSRDKTSTGFDFDGHSDECKTYSIDNHDTENNVNKLNDDFLHFDANTEVKDGCFRRLWRRLRGRV